MNTRESWLRQLTLGLQPWFASHGEWGIPDTLRVSVGWPSSGGLSPTRRKIGQCWSDEASADRHHEIFISPYLDDPIEVGATLVHELVHAIVGVEEKHKGQFRVVAKQVGLEGKMTATTPSAALTEELRRIATEIGPYPHASLREMKTTQKPQKGRMVKLTCKDCGYVLRTTKKWIEKGLPICAHMANDIVSKTSPIIQTMVVEEPEGGEDE